MQKTLLFFTLIALTTISFTSWSYDRTMAQHFSKLFSEVKGANAGKALHYLNVESFVQDLKEKKDLLAIDVRTPAETELISLTIPNSLNIPANEIFQ